MGTLFIVATPIGNIQDISFRAARLLLTADIIVCEDTRKTSILLSEIAKLFSGYHERQKPNLISFYEEVENKKTSEILTLLQSGKDILLVSDAGTPTISDPGFKLVRTCRENGIKIEAIPGPSAVIAALSVSGLPTDSFYFVGYPPKKQGHRKTFWKKLQKAKNELRTTIICYEAPHRIQQTLEEMIPIFGEDFQIVFVRELTKLYEEVKQESLKSMKEYFANTEPRGEFVLLF